MVEMSESKLNVALTALEKARTAAMEAAIAERQYRLCSVLDENGNVQRGIDKARRMLAPKAEKAEKATKTSKK
jgi:hypothetical protein